MSLRAATITDICRPDRPGIYDGREIIVQVSQVDVHAFPDHAAGIYFRGMNDLSVIIGNPSSTPVDFEIEAMTSPVTRRFYQMTWLDGHQKGGVQGQLPPESQWTQELSNVPASEAIRVRTCALACPNVPTPHVVWSKPALELPAWILEWEGVRFFDPKTDSYGYVQSIGTLAYTRTRFEDGSQSAILPLSFRELRRLMRTDR